MTPVLPFPTVKEFPEPAACLSFGGCPGTGATGTDFAGREAAGITVLFSLASIRGNRSGGGRGKLLKPVSTVGVGQTGYAPWFQRMLAEQGHELWIGDAGAIRAAQVRKQKTDARDAPHLLELLVEKTAFPGFGWHPRRIEIPGTCCDIGTSWSAGRLRSAISCTRWRWAKASAAGRSCGASVGASNWRLWRCGTGAAGEGRTCWRCWIGWDRRSRSWTRP